MIGSVTRTSPLDPRLTATLATFLAERPPGSDEDVHMVSANVAHVIERCSEPGDLVFDPFAGFGTTIEQATALGRSALGIELLPERVEYLRRRVPQAQIIEGDARELLRIIPTGAPQAARSFVDLIVTAPPYMTFENHAADPLTAYEKNDGDYSRYLAELGLVAGQCAQVVKPGGYVVWNLADIFHMGATTHLIRDCSRVLAQHLTPVGNTEILWDTYPHDLIADALLVFQRPA